jgi:hypothetical protein
MRVVHAAVLWALLMPAADAAQQTPGPDGTAAVPARVEQAPPSSASSVRTFNTPVGVLFNAVRPERVADFEKVVGYLQAALAASTDATVRAQAQGWKVLKASESGPNGSVLYVFLLDPAVPGADYSLGHILADAYPDTAQLQEIWKLYTDSVASGGSLLSLTPVQPSATAAEPLVPLPRMLPPAK